MNTVYVNAFRSPTLCSVTCEKIFGSHSVFNTDLHIVQQYNDILIATIERIIKCSDILAISYLHEKEPVLNSLH